MKNLIPIDVLLSSFGNIEGGIIILSPEGKVVYLNDWVLDHGVMHSDDYSNKPLEDVFLGKVSKQLLDSVSNAAALSLSRVLSHKIHKEILPLYRDKRSSIRLPLNISALISPLKGGNGILIRIVDYTSLVKREKQIRINESLLTIERNHFKKASDPDVTLEGFIASLIDDISWNVSSISIRLSFITENSVFRYPENTNSDSLSRSEKMVQNKESEEGSLSIAVEALSIEHKTRISLLEFSDKNTKIAVEFMKNSEHILDVSFDKTVIKIKDIILSLIEWKISYEKLTYMASHDELTGLYNRSYLIEQFDTYQKDIEQTGVGHISLFFVDLNKFKQINDEFGHQFGDKVLIKVSQRIQKCLVSGNKAFRMGGDEFLVMGKDAESDGYVETLKAKISSPFLCGSEVVSISSSIGRACYPKDGSSLDELIHLADKEMYSEK